MAGARNFLAQNQAVQNTQGTAIYILGWLSFVIAFVGGAYAAESWIGDIIAWIAGLLPWWWVPNALLGVGFVFVARDLLQDLTPNQACLTFAIVAPSVATASSNSTLASRITDWSNAMQAGVGGQLGSFFGNLGASGMAILAILLALLIGKSVLAKQSAAAGRSGGGPR